MLAMGRIWISTSSQNFNTVYSMLTDDETQMDNFDKEIDQMPDNSGLPILVSASDLVKVASPHHLRKQP